MMTDKNQTEEDAKNLVTPQDDSAPKAAKPSEATQELTDEEIAAVAGGLNVVQHKTKWTPYTP